MSFSANSGIALLAAVAVLVPAVTSYAGYLKARKDGVSRAEFILNKAGGADNLLKKSNIERWFAYVLILCPFLILTLPSKQFVTNVAVVIMIEIVLLPVGLLLLWDSRSARRIAETKKREQSCG
ncbi:hypothetical protein [Collimonas pratensis]|uniref:hypothetical protein n=1 Tax=Collimonas pratensis TaxID=279113 RepID=UPI00197EE7D9|nr:hypothetical protein [Collimonas pratensis]